MMCVSHESQNKHNMKAVRFASYGTLSEIKSHKEMTKNQKDLLWYNNDDFHVFKKNVSHESQNMHNMKTVRFASFCTLSEIKSHKEMSKNQKDLLWYNNDDMHMFKQNIVSMILSKKKNNEIM